MRGGHGHGPPGKSKAETPFFQLLGQTVPYVWTRNSLFLKLTFLLAIFFLICGSIGDLVVPITLKYAVDSLDGLDPSFPVYAILVYGVASFLNTACDQLRDIFFAYVSANTERLVALETFEHLQSLSLQFHLRRETGAVLRSVSRGASSFAGLLRIILFQILPVFVQVIVVCIYLFLKYEWYFGAVTGGVIVLYFTFTLTTTDWRDKYRRVMNEKDNEFNQKVSRTRQTRVGGGRRQPQLQQTRNARSCSFFVSCCAPSLFLTRRRTPC